MMNIEEYKNSKKNNVKKQKNYFNIYLIKIMICIILFLFFLIVNKKITGFNDWIYSNFYMNNLSFAKFNSWYKEKFGDFLPFKSLDDVQVFSESLDYINKEIYFDGVKLTVKDNYIVPIINERIKSLLFDNSSDKKY